MEAPNQPYPYQRRIAEMLLNKQNVILQAPTGAGKTHAALLPFLNGLEHNRDFPKKCIYSVPMRVLANQFVEAYTEKVKRAGRSDKIKVTIQTGEQPEDRDFKSDLIFATIDQTLSSFLISPYSLPKRRANLNAAAVMASYLVFDEFHLYDPTAMLPTTLHMLQLLKGITPFILMTATFSENMLRGLADVLKAEIVPGTEEERDQLNELPSQDKQRRYHIADEPLSAEGVIDAHQRRSLVICNTVDRARWLYEQLQQVKDSATEVLLLHSRFLRDDRNVIEDKIRARFGKDDPGNGSLIVVSTQAIEVGVDITSTVLHTELAPANAILQRTGRCARYPNDEGEVFIYQQVRVPDSDKPVDLCEDIAPYMSQKDQFTLTLDAFRQYEKQLLTFTHEQEIISQVHGQRDQEIILALKSSTYDHRRKMFAVMQGLAESDAKSLIRDDFQQRVTIHADPDVLKDSPYDAEAFSLHPGTLQKYIKGWLERAVDLEIDDAVQYLSEIDDPEQSNKSVYKWETVYEPRHVKGARLIVVNPALATYDSVLGFLPDRGGTWEAKLPPPKERTDSPPIYRLETYEEHIRQVYRAFHEEFWSEMAGTAARLEDRFGWEKGSVRKATELAILLHDVGKLSRKWQGWVRDYQQKIGMPVQTGQAYAHTELQSDFHREAEQEIRKTSPRPWHAVESGVACIEILVQYFGEGHPLINAVFSAIARHHAPFSDNNQSFRLTKDAKNHILATLQAVNFQIDFPLELFGEDEEISPEFGAADAIAQPHDLAAYLAYILIARVLRRSDVEGTKFGSKH